MWNANTCFAYFNYTSISLTFFIKLSLHHHAIWVFKPGFIVIARSAFRPPEMFSLYRGREIVFESLKTFVRNYLFNFFINPLLKHRVWDFLSNCINNLVLLKSKWDPFATSTFLLLFILRYRLPSKFYCRLKLFIRNISFLAYHFFRWILTDFIIFRLWFFFLFTRPLK